MLRLSLHPLLAVALATTLAPAQPPGAQDPALDNLAHAAGYETAALGTLGAVVERGRGPIDMVLVSGFGVGAGAFAAFMERNTEHYHMLAVTLPGLEGSAAPPMPPAGTSYGEQTWTNAAVDAVAQLVVERKLDRPVLVGHFVNGTQVAVRLAMRHPDLSRALILMAGTPRFEPVEAMPTWPRGMTVDQKVTAVDRFLAPRWFKTVTRPTWVAGNFTADDYSSDAARGKTCADRANEPPLPVLIRYLCEFHASDVRADLAKLRLPLLLLQPTFTAQAHADPQRSYLRAYFAEPWQGVLDDRPDTVRIDVADAGIMVMDDQPEKVDQAIAAFLARHPVQSRRATPRAAEAPQVVHRILEFAADDGTPLQAKLTLPAAATAATPVVFFLHGAGARTFDSPFLYRDADGKVQIGSYLAYHADELARRGVGLFRMSKRGCTPQPEPPGMRVDREVFGKTTMALLLDDYAHGLAALRAEPGVDRDRIVLLGSSEGTRLAPQLALRAPDGIIGVAMMAYAADNARKTVEWQNSIGPWRNIQHLLPAARDGVLTRDEYDAAVKDNPALARALPLAALDADKDGSLGPQDMARTVRPRLDAILKAVQEQDDDFLWQHLSKLSSAYLRDWWEAEPNLEILLRLHVPLAIFHGALDGSCRVEGVHETAAAFREAGRTDLEVHIYEDGDHDLNWTYDTSKDGGPQPYRDAFDLIATWIAAR